MKKLVSIMLVASISIAALAQPQGEHKKGPGHQDMEKIQSEKIAFITEEVGLTPEEAQAFWPVYNEIEAQQKNLMKAERKAYGELNKALKSGEGNVQALLDAYLAAKKDNVNLHVANAKSYAKVLPTEKVAKFYTCEEKFRRQQIGRLCGKDGKGQGGPRGGKAPKGERPQKDKANADKAQSE